MQFNKKTIIIISSIIGISLFIFYLLSNNDTTIDEGNNIAQSTNDVHDYTKKTNASEDTNDINDENNIDSVENNDSDSNQSNNNENKENDEDELELTEEDFEFDENEIGYDKEDDFNYEKYVKDKVGKKQYKSIMKTSEKVVEHYARGNEEEFLKYSTKKMKERIKNDELSFLNYEGEIQVDIFPVEQNHPDDIVIGSIISSENNENSLQINFIFTKENKEYKVDNFVVIWSS